MKKLGVLAFFLFTFINQGIAQDSIEKNVGDFEAIKVFNKIKVRLEKGTENKVRVVGSKKEKVSFKNNNGLLKIAMAINNLWDHNTTEVIVYYTGIKLLDANEGSSIQVAEKMVQKEIELRVQEGAMIRAALDVQYLKARAVTGGIINIEGDAKEQEVSITTGGGFFARNLETNRTTVKISAGGIAEVDARSFVKANTNAGGEIKIYGNPKELDSKSILGGKIIEMN